jgi:TonB family protein
MRKDIVAVLTYLILSYPLIAQVSEPPFTYVEQMPQFKGGKDALYQFVSEHIVYPDSAKANNIEGIVIVQFVVDIDSLAKEVKILKGIGYGCDEALLKVIDQMNQESMWIPGRHNNKARPVIYTMPVTFKLEGKPGKEKKKTKKTK